MSHSPTTTIHLLPQEELSSLLSRIADSHADHITLVLPDKSIVAQGLIGLQILADEAKKINKQVTVVSDSPQIQRLAKRVGLDVSGGSQGLPEHGFVAGADVAEMEQALDMSRPEEKSAGAVLPVADATPVTTEPETPAARSVTRKADSPAGRLAGVMAHLRGHGWKWGVGLAAALLLLGGGALYALAYYLPQATVTVFAEKQTLDRDVTITVDPNATSANVKTLTVPATAVTAQANKTQTFPATGKKDIGTKAGGTVTIYNKTDKDKTLAAGTVLTASGLQFLLTTSITVESATTETGIDPITLKMTTVTTPGSADVTVAAADIGDNYNLDAKSTFTVAKFDASSFSGRNDKALAGGSKKSVKVVTATDQSEALDTLDSSLADDAAQALKAKVTSGKELLAETVKQEVTTKEYSQQVGDQADEFTLTLEVSANGLIVDPDDIRSMLDTEVAAKVPDGYRLDTEHSSIENHVLSTEEDGAVRLTSTYKTQVIPEIDVEAMRKAIAGKNPSVVEDYLKSQSNLHGYDITLKPKLPGPFYHLPSIESHIDIKVQVK